MLFFSAITADHALAGLIVSDSQSLACLPTNGTAVSADASQTSAVIRSANSATGMWQTATLDQSHQNVAAKAHPECLLKQRITQRTARIADARLPDWIPIRLLKVPI
ncbi:MAG: hypothetical protein F9B45_05140 [Phycisphaera sp. RhM]|nr:hypothetical protein [Phycisphaera sp. RhM]